MSLRSVFSVAAQTGIIKDGEPRRCGLQVDPSSVVKQRAAVGCDPLCFLLPVSLLTASLFRSSLSNAHVDRVVLGKDAQCRREIRRTAHKVFGI